jgi:hypothetical protein
LGHSSATMSLQADESKMIAHVVDTWQRAS